MIDVVPFIAGDIERVSEQPTMAPIGEYITHEQRKKLQHNRYSYTVLSGKNVIACIGIVEHYENRGEAWAILADGCRKDFMGIHRAVLKFLKETQVKRIEAVVMKDFKEGHRWARLLGFELEAETLRCYDQLGNDYSLYARVK